MSHARVQRGVVTRVGFGFHLEGHARLRGVRERQPEVDLSVLVAVFAVSVRADVSRGRAGLESKRGWTLDVESRGFVLGERAARDESATHAGHDDVLDEPVEGWEDAFLALVGGDEVGEVCLRGVARARLGVRQGPDGDPEVLETRAGGVHVLVLGPRAHGRARATKQARDGDAKRVGGAVIGHREHLRLAERVGESAAGGDGAGVALTTLAVHRAVRRRTQDGGARRVHRRGRHAGVTARN